VAWCRRTKNRSGCEEFSRVQFQHRSDQELFLGRVDRPGGNAQSRDTARLVTRPRASRGFRRWRSELFPTPAAAALSQTSRQETYLGTRYYRQTFQDFQGALDLNYAVFDFGARAGRIDASKAEVLAANFEFNDTHRSVIHRVEQAYYHLLNASGQEDAARASLSNAPDERRPPGLGSERPRTSTSLERGRLLSISRME
jgi:hypothetical protein